MNIVIALTQAELNFYVYGHSSIVNKTLSLLVPFTATGLKICSCVVAYIHFDLTKGRIMG